MTEMINLSMMKKK